MFSFHVCCPVLTLHCRQLGEEGSGSPHYRHWTRLFVSPLLLRLDVVGYLKSLLLYLLVPCYHWVPYYFFLFHITQHLGLPHESARITLPIVHSPSSWYLLRIYAFFFFDDCVSDFVWIWLFDLLKFVVIDALHHIVSWCPHSHLWKIQLHYLLNYIFFYYDLANVIDICVQSRALLMPFSAHLKDVARRAKHQFRSGLSKALPKKAWKHCNTCSLVVSHRISLYFPRR